MKKFMVLMALLVMLVTPAFADNLCNTQSYTTTGFVSITGVACDVYEIVLIGVPTHITITVFNNTTTAQADNPLANTITVYTEAIINQMMTASPDGNLHLNLSSLVTRNKNNANNSVVHWGEEPQVVPYRFTYGCIVKVSCGSDYILVKGSSYIR